MDHLQSHQKLQDTGCENLGQEKNYYPMKARKLVDDMAYSLEPEDKDRFHLQLYSFPELKQRNQAGADMENLFNNQELLPIIPSVLMTLLNDSAV
ncbi:hypothetical protein AWC38_SpisGene5009 [Stylophora pistillata]|uniref:Uncharacterized protein n=1 Tax=Stylophora pistillata TaxID=50429 RepID=A0A2B4SNR2_STYPI|nr:hypothetical protein AWC38_SpisGene5009 [Stylophora pistillata]